MTQNARNGRKTAIWSVANFGGQSLLPFLTIADHFSVFSALKPLNKVDSPLDFQTFPHLCYDFRIYISDDSYLLPSSNICEPVEHF